MLTNLQYVIYLALFLVVFVLCLVGLLDAARRPPRAFLDAGKRTKGFWTAILGAATAISFVSIPWPVGIGAFSTLFALACAIAGGVYLADVKPAVARYSGRGPSGPSGPRGGW